jgi:hypothetical protein
MAKDAHLQIEEVSTQAKPLLPKANTAEFVSQCGYIARDNIPITIQKWHKPAKGDEVSFVEDRIKDFLWEFHISHFTLPV